MQKIILGSTVVSQERLESTACWGVRFSVVAKAAQQCIGPGGRGKHTHTHARAHTHMAAPSVSHRVKEWSQAVIISGSSCWINLVHFKSTSLSVLHSSTIVPSISEQVSNVTICFKKHSFSP